MGFANMVAELNNGGEPSGGEPKGGEPEDGEPDGGEIEGGETSQAAGERSGGEPEAGERSGREPEGGEPEGGEVDVAALLSAGDEFSDDEDLLAEADDCPALIHPFSEDDDDEDDVHGFRSQPISTQIPGNGRSEELVHPELAIGAPLSQSVANESTMVRGLHAMVGLAGKARVTGADCDADGAQMPYAKSTLKGDLFAIKKHISGNMGRAFDVSKLAYVEKARQGINNCLDADNKTRAMSLEDSLMAEGWQCFDPAYAADRFLMGVTGFGEAMGPRCSDLFAARRSHFEKVPMRGGTRGGWKWRRFSGKSNSSARRRVRSFCHPPHCKRAQGAAGSASQHAVAIDPVLGLLPETRCGPCSFESMTDAADCDGSHHEHVAAFRGLIPGAKFSWERGAKPMPLKADGSRDGTGFFTRGPLTVHRINRLLHRWGQRINFRRKVAIQ